MPIGGDTGKKGKVKNYIPPVPIKTYKWEDVRRSRRRGGYPWTYLYKPPLTEEEGTSIMDKIKEKTKKVKKTKKAPEPKPKETEKTTEVAEPEVVIIRLRDDIDDEVLKEKNEDTPEVKPEDEQGDKLDGGKADENVIKDESLTAEIKEEKDTEDKVESVELPSDIKQEEKVEKPRMRRWDEPVDEVELPKDDKTTADVELSSITSDKPRMRRWDEPVEDQEIPKDDPPKEEIAESAVVESKVEDEVKEKPKMRRWDEPVEEAEISTESGVKPAEVSEEAVKTMEKPRMRRWDEPVEDEPAKEVTAETVAASESATGEEVKEKPRMRRWDEPVDDADLPMGTDDSKKDEAAATAPTEEEFNYELSLKSTITDEDILAAGNRICEMVLKEKGAILHPEPKLKRQESIIDKIKGKTKIFKKHKKSDASDHKPEGKGIEKSKSSSSLTPTTPVRSTTPILTAPPVETATSKETEFIIIRLKDENAPQTADDEHATDTVEERDKENIVPEESKPMASELALSGDSKADPLKKSDSKTVLTEQTVALASKTKEKSVPRETQDGKKDESIIDKIKDKTKQLIMPKKSTSAKPDPKQLETPAKAVVQAEPEPDITIIRLKGDPDEAVEPKLQDVEEKMDVDAEDVLVPKRESTPQPALIVETASTAIVPEEKPVEKEPKEKKDDSLFGKLKEKTRFLKKRDKTPEAKKRDKTPDGKKRDKTPDSKKKPEAPKAPPQKKEDEPDVIIIRLKHDSDEDRDSEENVSAKIEGKTEQTQEEIVAEIKDVGGKTEENVQTSEKPRMRRWDEPVEESELAIEKDEAKEEVKAVEKPRMRRWDEPVEDVEISKDIEVKEPEKAEEIVQVAEKPRMRRWDEPVEDVEISKDVEVKEPEKAEEIVQVAEKPRMRRWDEPVENVEIPKDVKVKEPEKAEEIVQVAEKPRMRRWDEPVEDAEIPKEEETKPAEKPEENVTVIEKPRMRRWDEPVEEAEMPKDEEIKSVEKPRMRRWDEPVDDIEIPEADKEIVKEVEKPRMRRWDEPVDDIDLPKDVKEDISAAVKEKQLSDVIKAAPAEIEKPKVVALKPKKKDEGFMDRIKGKTKQFGFKKKDKDSLPKKGTRKLTETKPVFEKVKRIAPKEPEPDVIIIRLRHDSDEDRPDDETPQSLEIPAETEADKNESVVEEEEEEKETKEAEKVSQQLDVEENSTSEDISQYLDKDEPIPERKEPTIVQKPLKDEDASVPGTSADKKEEELKKKRKLSVESKISLSSLGVMKKLRETKDKIKMPSMPKISMPKFQMKKKPDLKKIVKTKTKVTSVKRKEHSPKEVQKVIQETSKKTKSDSPVYIHIPLKVPPKTEKPSDLGLPMDLEEDEEKLPSSEKAEETEPIQEVVDLPPVVVTKDVVIIPLEVTKHAEGDLTILEDKLKIIDLTKEDVVEIKPEEPAKLPEKPTKRTRAKKPVPIVDEEDGLKLTPAAIAEETAKEEALTEIAEEPELKSSLKTVEEQKSPVFRKKVSFKKRPSSKASEESRIYESFDIPKDLSPSPKPEDDSESTEKEESAVTVVDSAKREKLKASQSMSVDEEKSYLDKVLIKTTSLEDDYQKWSKLSDHEYEPINPPGPEIQHTQGPTDHQAAHVDESTGELRHKSGGSLASSTTSLDRKYLHPVPLDDEVVLPGDGEAEDEAMAGKNLGDGASAQDLHTKDQRYCATPTTVGSRTESRTDGEFNTSQYNSSVLEDLPLHKDSRKRATLAQAEGSRGSSIQQSLRNHAGRIKTRLKGIKRPTFTMPNRPKFERPKFQRPKFERPKFSMPDTSKFSLPKMPDRPKINFPSFTFPRRSTNTTRSTKSSGRDQPTSSESAAGGTKRNFFDFRTTYPRIFDKYRKSKDAPDVSKKIRKPTPPPEFATVPRVAGRKKGPVGSRWVHRFTDIKFADDESKKSRSREFGSSTGSPYIESLSSKDREDSVERRMAADARYNAAIASVDDDYERENREIHEVMSYDEELTKRWSRGSFHENRTRMEDEEEMEQNVNAEGALNVEEEIAHGEGDRRYNTESLQSIDTNQEERASGSSSDRHRRGVLEEIDDDEFFLRQKGISQDNIEVGAYLSSEIREAFRTPVNALSQMNRENRYYGHEYDLDVSDHSAGQPPEPTKRRIKKPKRVKKTPHVSQEEMSYDQDSILTEPEEYPKSYGSYSQSLPPARPKRGKKAKKEDAGIVPYQETIQVEEQFAPIHPDDDEAEEIRRHMQEIEEAQHQEDEEYRVEHLSRYYENELMKDIHQPEIFIIDDPQKDYNSNRYENYQHEEYMSDDQAEFEQSPIAPKRKNKSLRSLNSDVDSIFDEINPKREMFGDIPVQEITAYRAEHDFMVLPGERPIPPKRSRTRSPRSRTVSVGDEDRTSRGAESLASDAEGQIPCDEPMCVQDTRDSMGYAIIDKNRQLEPPLPPKKPSIPKRRKSTKSNSSRKSNGETKFFTVPRPLNDTTSGPVRPTRNYSTLGPSRPPRRSTSNLADEEKENIDITQYIEITDDEPARHLQSGEVIQKMKDRPLPAPPRPPRKTRGSGKDALSDITHEENIIPTTRSQDKSEISPTSKQEIVDEIDMSTQTDPLPEDFVTCDEITEVSERVTAPRRRRTSSRSSSRFGSKSSMSRKTPDRSRTPVEVLGTEEIKIKSRPQTPTNESFENEETITHASLLVQPVDNAQILPNSYVSQRFGDEGALDLFPTPDKIKEMISDIIAHRQSEMAQEKDLDDEESSEVPESFKLLKDPPVETIIPTRRIDDDDYSEIPEDFKKLKAAETHHTQETLTLGALEQEEPQDVPVSAPVRTKRSADKKIVEDDYAEIPDRLDEVCPPPVETPVRTKRKSDKKASDGETTEIPIDFHELKDPPAIAQVLPSSSITQQEQPQPRIIERIIERQVPFSVIPGPETEVDLLKTQRLQVGDLDVERLNVSQLQAQKIVVSEIEGGHLTVNEIDSKSGNLIIAGIEFPPNLIKDLLEKLQAAAAAQAPPVPPPRQVINRQTSTDCPSIRQEPDVAKKDSDSGQKAGEGDTGASISEPAVEQEPAPSDERIETAIETFAKQSSLDESILAAIEEQIQQLEAVVPVTVETTRKPEEEPVVAEQEQIVSEALLEQQVKETVATVKEEVEKAEIEVVEVAVPDLQKEIPTEANIKVKEAIVESPIVEETISVEKVLAHESAAAEVASSVVEEEPLVEATVKSVPEEDTVCEETPALEPLEPITKELTGECSSVDLGSEVLPSLDYESDGQKKTSPTRLSDNEKSQEDSQTESPSPLPSDEPDSVVDLLDDENQLKKNLVEKLVDDIILVAEEFVEKTLDLDESVTRVSQTFPIDADVVVEEFFLMEAPPQTHMTEVRPPTRPIRAHEVRFGHLETRSSESDEVPQLIEIHHMEFTRSRDLAEEKPPELPPKQRKMPPAQKSSESEAAPERPQLPAYHSVPYATSFYPEYIPSAPPPPFFTMRHPRHQEVSEDELPVPPRRRRHHRAVSRSSSEDVHHALHRRHVTRSPEPSIPQLGGQLARACVNSMDRSIRRVVNHVMTNILGLAEGGKQDLHVVLIILLVLIAGLILLGFGSDKTVHLHHWEYFNPPRDL